MTDVWPDEHLTPAAILPPKWEDDAYQIPSATDKRPRTAHDFRAHYYRLQLILQDSGPAAQSAHGRQFYTRVLESISLHRMGTRSVPYRVRPHNQESGAWQESKFSLWHRLLLATAIKTLHDRACCPNLPEELEGFATVGDIHALTGAGNSQDHKKLSQLITNPPGALLDDATLAEFLREGNRQGHRPGHNRQELLHIVRRFSCRDPEGQTYPVFYLGNTRVGSNLHPHDLRSWDWPKLSRLRLVGLGGERWELVDPNGRVLAFRRVKALRSTAVAHREGDPIVPAQCTLVLILAVSGGPGHVLAAVRDALEILLPALSRIAGGTLRILDLRQGSIRVSLHGPTHAVSTLGRLIAAESPQLLLLLRRCSVTEFAGLPINGQLTDDLAAGWVRQFSVLMIEELVEFFAGSADLLFERYEQGTLFNPPPQPTLGVAFGSGRLRRSTLRLFQALAEGATGLGKDLVGLGYADSPTHGNREALARQTGEHVTSLVSTLRSSRQFGAEASASATIDAILRVLTQLASSPHDDT